MKDCGFYYVGDVRELPLMVKNVILLQLFCLLIADDVAGAQH